MRKWMHRTRNGVLGAALVGALGFGATQALAAPGEAAQGPVCNTVDCRQLCRTLGYAEGFCSRGGCFCYGTR